MIRKIPQPNLLYGDEGPDTNKAMVFLSAYKFPYESHQISDLRTIDSRKPHSPYSPPILVLRSEERILFGLEAIRSLPVNRNIGIKRTLPDKVDNALKS